MKGCILLALLLVSSALVGFPVAFRPPDTAPVHAGINAAQSSAPVIVGWGGTRLDESSTFDSSNPTSQVFSGEQASNQEVQVRKLLDMGFNAARVSFESSCTSKQEMGPYDPANLERSIAIAEHYGFWIIVDYHGYDDLATARDSDCWLNFWRPVVQQFTSRYDKIVWEPLNEPTGIGDDVQYLSGQYQRWIDQARSVGDTHWIVAQNVCSYGCGLSNFADGFPSVTDTAGRVFISLHTYMGFSENSGSWDNATAESVAQAYYQAVLDGETRTGWPVLNTEGGADELCDNCAPDEVLTGSAGYTTVTFHFIQKLTNLYDANSPQRTNWVWWTMGSWTNTPGAGLFGSLAPNGWGSLLQYERVGHASTLSASFTSQPTTPAAGQTITFTATASNGSPPYSYTWNFGDGGTTSGQAVDHAYSQAGDYTVRLTVTDSSSDSSIAQTSLSIGGGGGNSPPVLSVPGPGPQTIDELTQLAFTVRATDPDVPAQTLTLTASGLPPGSSFGPGNGRFAWAPTESQGPANYTATFNASDGNGGSATANVDIHVQEVNSQPSIVPPGPKTVASGGSMSVIVQVTDPDIPQNTVTLAASGLVPGMVFDSSARTLSFRPQQAQAGQNFTITFTATDDGTPALSDTRAEVVSVVTGSANGGDCLLCVSSTYTWLLGVGILIGLTLSFAALSLRRRR